MSQNTMTTARWYCVSNIGLATLCNSQRDAETVAAESDRDWPKGGPHKAVPLGDVRALTAERDRLAAEVANLTAAVRDVQAERRRQIEVEGWTSERDDAYIDGAMALAAGSYCESAARPVLLARTPGAAFALPKLWPSSWATEWWKPRNPRADLVRAGALILAEIERLDRAAMKGKP